MVGLGVTLVVYDGDELAAAVGVNGMELVGADRLAELKFGTGGAGGNCDVVTVRVGAEAISAAEAKTSSRTFCGILACWRSSLMALSK
jgi:hypothetical protein